MTSNGLHVVKEMLRRVQSEQVSHIQGDSEENITVRSIPTSHTKQLLNQKQLVLVKKEKNIYNRIFKLYPSLSTTHIYRLFGFMAINERSLVDPQFEESYFSTYFNGRIIKKVQFYNNSIVMEMSPAVIPQHQPPVQYFIQKNKSYGGDILYSIANQIQEVYQQLKKISKPQNSQQKFESIKKCLDSLGDSMYVCTLGVNKVAISKSLLSYLDYDLEQFGIEAVKYKTIFHELFSANYYAKNVLHWIRNLKYTVHLFQNKLSLNQFYKKTSLKFSDFIYSKTGVSSFCQMSFSSFSPTFFCHKIDFIYYKEGQSTQNEIKESELRLAIEGQQQIMRQQEYHLIQKVKSIPSHLLKQNQNLIATYRQIQTNNEQIQEQN